MRVRISTAFLMIALAFFPLSTYIVPYKKTNPFGHDSTIGYYWDWIVYHFAPGLFGVALILAFTFAIWFGFKKRWYALAQQTLEIVLCLVFTLFLPVY